MQSVFIPVFHIFSADHQRAAQVLAKNLHAERGETADEIKRWEHLQSLSLFLYLTQSCLVVYVCLGDVPGGDRGDPGCDRAIPVH